MVRHTIVISTCPIMPQTHTIEFALEPINWMDTDFSITEKAFVQDNRANGEKGYNGEQ